MMFTRRPLAANLQTLVLDPPDYYGLMPIVLPPGRHLIGTGADCRIRLEAEGVLDRHALVLVGDKRTVIKSFDSRTWVNDAAVSETALRAGDRLSIGPLTFRVRAASPDELAEVESPEPPTGAEPARAVAAPPPAVAARPRPSVRQAPVADRTGKPERPRNKGTTGSPRPAVDLDSHLLESRLTALQHRVAELRQTTDQIVQPATATAELAESDVMHPLHQLHVRHEELQRRSVQIAEESRQLQERLKQVAERESRVEQNQQQLRLEAERIANVAESARRSLAEDHARHMAIRQEWEAAYQRMTGELASQLDTIDRQRDSLQDEADRLTAARTELQTLRSDLEQKRQVLAAERTRLTSDQAELASLEAQLESQLRHHRRDVEEQAAQLETERQEVGRLRAELLAAQQNLARERETLAADWSEQVARIEQENHRRICLQARLDEERSLLAQERESLSVLASDLVRDRSTLEAERAELEDSRNRAEAAQRESQRLNDRCQRAEAELSQLRQQVAADRAALEQSRENELRIQSGMQSQLNENRRQLLLERQQVEELRRLLEAERNALVARQSTAGAAVAGPLPDVIPDQTAARMDSGPLSMAIASISQPALIPPPLPQGAESSLRDADLKTWAGADAAVESAVPSLTPPQLPVLASVPEAGAVTELGAVTGIDADAVSRIGADTVVQVVSGIGAAAASETATAEPEAGSQITVVPAALLVGVPVAETATVTNTATVTEVSVAEVSVAADAAVIASTAAVRDAASETAAVPETVLVAENSVTAATTAEPGEVTTLPWGTDVDSAQPPGEVTDAGWMAAGVDVPADPPSVPVSISAPARSASSDPWDVALSSLDSAAVAALEVARDTDTPSSTGGSWTAAAMAPSASEPFGASATGFPGAGSGVEGFSTGPALRPGSDPFAAFLEPAASVADQAWPVEAPMSADETLAEVNRQFGVPVEVSPAEPATPPLPAWWVETPSAGSGTRTTEENADSLRPSPVESLPVESVEQLHNQLAKLFDLPADLRPVSVETDETNVVEGPAAVVAEAVETAAVEPAAADSNVEPASVAVATAVVANAVEPAPEKHHDDSVDAFMARLLARSRTGSDERDPAAADQAAAAVAQVAPMAPIVQNLDRSHLMAEPKHKQDKQAVRENLQSFREVAHLSARSALARHSLQQLRNATVAKGILMGFAAITTAVYLTEPLWDEQMYMWKVSGGALATLLSALEFRRSWMRLTMPTTVPVVPNHVPETGEIESSSAGVDSTDSPAATDGLSRGEEPVTAGE